MRYRNTIWHPPKLPHWNRSLFAELAALHTQPDSVPGAFGHRGRPAEEREHMSPISGPLKGVFSWTKMAGRTAFAIHKCFFPATVFLSAEQTEHAGIRWWGCFCSTRNMRCKVSFCMAECWAPHFYSTFTHLVPALQFAKLTSAGETGPTGLRIILFPLAVIHSGVGVWIKSDQEVCRKLPEKFCSALNKKQQEVSLSFPCQMRMW